MQHCKKSLCTFRRYKSSKSPASLLPTELPSTNRSTWCHGSHPPPDRGDHNPHFHRKAPVKITPAESLLPLYSLRNIVPLRIAHLISQCVTRCRILLNSEMGQTQSLHGRCKLLCYLLTYESAQPMLCSPHSPATRPPPLFCHSTRCHLHLSHLLQLLLAAL
jgi:hypothetical protein